MSYPRHVPLFQVGPEACTWNQQMQHGEYALHFSTFEEAGVAPYCMVFASLEDASGYGRQTVQARPAVKCTIYDEHGFVGAPLREIRGTAYKGDGGLSARFRRWAGSILFFGGLILALIDWRADFRFSWPAMLGTRMLIPGLILLVTEALVVLHARRQATLAAHGKAK